MLKEEFEAKKMRRTTTGNEKHCQKLVYCSIFFCLLINKLIKSQRHPAVAVAVAVMYDVFKKDLNCSKKNFTLFSSSVISLRLNSFFKDSRTYLA